MPQPTTHFLPLRSTSDQPASPPARFLRPVLPFPDPPFESLRPKPARSPSLLTPGFSHWAKLSCLVLPAHNSHHFSFLRKNIIFNTRHTSFTTPQRLIFILIFTPCPHFDGGTAFSFDSRRTSAVEPIHAAPRLSPNPTTAASIYRPSNSDSTSRPLSSRGMASPTPETTP